MSRRSGALTYTAPLGPPRPVAGNLYLYLKDIALSLEVVFAVLILDFTESEPAQRSKYFELKL
jgi:hypothetical protein